MRQWMIENPLLSLIIGCFLIMLIDQIVVTIYEWIKK